MRLSIIVAAARNGAIGRDGQLPWRLSADLQRFKKLTMGHAIVMGRKTYESIGRLLPGRTSVILTRQADYHVEGAHVVHDLDAACQVGGNDDEVFVIGGAEIYRLALPSAQRIYLTQVDAEVEGDTFFPELDTGQWTETSSTQHDADEKNEYAHRFVILDR